MGARELQDQSRRSAEMNMIYLIERLWTDSMENNSYAAVGYAVAGYVATRDEAERIVNGCEMVPESACWAIRKPTPRFKYRAVEPFVPSAHLKDRACLSG
jgi:hypothetical protein